MQQIHAVQDVYKAQEIKTKEAESKGLTLDDDVDMVVSERRRSGSSSSSMSKSDQMFATVMSAFIPKPPPTYTPPSATDWFKEAGISDVQRAKLLLNFPEGTEATPLLLSALEDEELAAAELMPVQRRAFKKLQAMFNAVPK